MRIPIVCDIYFLIPLKCYRDIYSVDVDVEVSGLFNMLSLVCCFSGIPRFVSQPAPSTVRLGDNQVMACEVNSDLVPFTRWEKDRQPLELSNRLVLLPSGALVVSNATEADAGLYRCLVENVGSSKSSDEAQLQILPGKSELVKICQMSSENLSIIQSACLQLLPVNQTFSHL